MKAVEAWLEDLRLDLKGESLAVSEVRMGIFYTAVQLSSGHVGVAFTPRDLADTVCCPRSAAAAPPAGRMAGQDAWALARWALAPAPLRRAVGVAALNALSALAMQRYGVPGGRMIEGVDALEAADVRAGDRVAMVGAFAPFIKALNGRVAGLQVVDKHPEALKPHEVPFWAPGVSMKTICTGSASPPSCALGGRFFTPRIRLRVVCGRGDTATSRMPRIWLSSVDLPTLGRPRIATKPVRAWVGSASMVPAMYTISRRNHDYLPTPSPSPTIGPCSGWAGLP